MTLTNSQSPTKESTRLVTTLVLLIILKDSDGVCDAGLFDHHLIHLMFAVSDASCQSIDVPSLP